MLPLTGVGKLKSFPGNNIYAQQKKGSYAVRTPFWSVGPHEKDAGESSQRIRQKRSMPP